MKTKKMTKAQLQRQLNSAKRIIKFYSINRIDGYASCPTCRSVTIITHGDEGEMARKWRKRFDK